MLKNEEFSILDEAAEKKRIAALHEYNILDTKPERGFDELTRLAAEICEKPIARINLVDEERQWSKAVYGGNNAPIEVPRINTICQYTIRQYDLFEVEDLSKDDRFAGFSYVKGENGLRYYLGAPLVNPAGYVIGALCVLDYKPGRVSETKKRQLRTLADEVMVRIELQKKNSELKKLNEHKVALMKMLSHDMRSPLNGIIGMSSLLKVQIEDSEFREVAALLEQSAVELNQMVDEIMSYTLIESKGFELNRRPTSFREVSATIERLFRPVAKSKNIEMSVKNTIDIEADIDRSKFEQIFGNLLSNALKFTREGGRVEAILGLEHSDDNTEQIVLTVRDSGVGMSRGQISKLFENGMHTAGSGTAGEKSTGIGLSIIKHFVELHSGNIEVSSRPGEGTEFRVVIPAFAPDEDIDDPNCF
jgi:two-component system, sensor histidine kinase